MCNLYMKYVWKLEKRKLMMGEKCVLRKLCAHLLKNILFSCERNIVIQRILDEICSLEDYRLVYSFCDQNKMMQLGWLLVSASPSFIMRFSETEPYSQWTVLYDQHFTLENGVR